MKKLVLSVALIALSACTTIITKSEPVENTVVLKHICIRDNPRIFVRDLPQAFQKSLKKKGISSEIVKDYNAPNCKYFLVYSFKPGNDGFLKKGRTRLLEIENGSRTTIGDVGYARRSEEKQNVKVTGLQGQTDLIISELLKNK